MRTFSESLQQSQQRLNESKTLKVQSLDEFLAFGKQAYKSLMGVMYKEEPVHQYLTEMWNHAHGDSVAALDMLNEATMSMSEKRASVVQRFNSIVTQLTENTTDTVLQHKLIELVRSYPEILNEVAIANTAILLERCDIRGTYKMHEAGIDTKKLGKQNLVLAFYEPKNVKDMTNMLKTMRSVMHEAVIETEPGTYKTRVLPDGFGGFPVDFVPVINGQIKDAQRLESEIVNAVSVADVMSEEEQAYREEAFKMFTAFMQDETNRYNLSADRLQANLHDIDFFVMLCIIELLKPVNENLEHLQKNFFTTKLTQLNVLFDEYLKRAGLEFSRWTPNQKDDVVKIKKPSYAKLYELCEMVLGMSKYQKMYLRQIVLKMVTMIKPMIDSIRLDLKIYLDRTQLQY